ncbi:hypothetical protein BFW01_g571 [Lasiodiplodia theobromae]|nr:hypothetical protein BFW01_g571 [Lasiodiplodia theobromae]
MESGISNPDPSGEPFTNSPVLFSRNTSSTHITTAINGPQRPPYSLCPPQPATWWLSPCVLLFWPLPGSSPDTDTPQLSEDPGGGLQATNPCDVRALGFGHHHYCPSILPPPPGSRPSRLATTNPPSRPWRRLT